MVTITTDAREWLEAHQPSESEHAWLLDISWDRGDADHVRDAEGQWNWQRTPPRGWVVDIFGASIDALAAQLQLERHGPRLFVQPWLLPSPAFPDGVIDLDGDSLVFRANAA